VRTPVSEHLLSFNVAAVGLVDEFLRLPAASAAATAAALLYGRDTVVPLPFLDMVGTGARIPLSSMLLSPAPLATLLAGRLKPSPTWQEPGHALKGARALARERYRDLQAALVGSSGRPSHQPLGSLVRYTYGMDGRQWPWADAARRLLDAVVALNRSTLALLASLARGETVVDVGIPVAGPRWSFDMPPAIMDVLAEVLPPAAVPDFPTFVDALEATQARFERDEATVHYRSLFAEMLGLATHAEVLA
jgi:hypothetical protein